MIRSGWAGRSAGAGGCASRAVRGIEVGSPVRARLRVSEILWHAGILYDSLRTIPGTSMDPCRSFSSNSPESRGDGVRETRPPIMISRSWRGVMIVGEAGEK